MLTSNNALSATRISQAQPPGSIQRRMAHSRTLHLAEPVLKALKIDFNDPAGLLAEQRVERQLAAVLAADAPYI
jgi:hypothetical protein